MALSLRILIADDQPLNALALRSQVEALGHTVIGPATNGDEAVELAAQHSPDLAILDIRMPKLSGLEAAETIFRRRPLPVILLTGYSDEGLIERAASSPVAHYLMKPVSLEDLVPAISVARSRFEEWQHFKGEAATLERRLEDRALVDRAKAVLMQARGLSEADAFRTLQRESQRQNQPMVDIARNILTAHAVLQERGSD